jgi:hypothetical protein
VAGFALPRAKAERFAPGPISPPYPHPLRRFWQQPSKSWDQMWDMIVVLVIFIGVIMVAVVLYFVADVADWFD